MMDEQLHVQLKQRVEDKRLECAVSKEVLTQLQT